MYEADWMYEALGVPGGFLWVADLDSHSDRRNARKSYRWRITASRGLYIPRFDTKRASAIFVEVPSLIALKGNASRCRRINRFCDDV